VASLNTSPQVSVIIPTFERAPLVVRAIASALDQTMDELEVIVVDDGSTDETAAVVGALNDRRIRYFRHLRNRGGGDARNTGIDVARGAYIAFLDSDDSWLPAKLAVQLVSVRGYGPNAVSYGRVIKDYGSRTKECRCGHSQPASR